MVKSAVQVYIRTRPTSHFANNSIKIDVDSSEVNVHLPKLSGQEVNNQQEDWNFQFNKVLHNVSQEVVYQSCGREIVDNVMAGYNGTILAYGQTGAGKTFTMLGGTKNYQHRGLIPRSLAQIYQTIADRTEVDIQVRVSYLEIYNDTFYDLLDDSGKALTDLSVRENEEGDVTVKGLKRQLCYSEEDALNALFAGETNRAVGAHEMNKHSSRSHCIFTVYLEMRSQVESSEKVLKCKLNLVDLAGSERVGKTGSSGTALAEAKYINRSLSFLEQVVISLSGKNNREHVPFRQTKLTNVLRDSLGGNHKTRLIANVWTEQQHLEETISTLKFATRMMAVANDTSVNVVEDPVLMMKKYQRQIQELKQELAMHDTLAHRSNISYEEYTPEENQELYKQVQQYARGETGELEIVNLRQIRGLFRQFKNFAQDLQTEINAGRAAVLSNNFSLSTFTTTTNNNNNNQVITVQAPSLLEASSLAQAAPMVGELRSGTAGFSMGQAPASFLPALPSPRAGSASNNNTGTPAPASARSASSSSSPSGAGGEFDLQNGNGAQTAAFQEYTETEGSGAHATYKQNEEDLRRRKENFRTVSLQVNQMKQNIDQLKLLLEGKRVERQQQVNDRSPNSDSVVIDEEEYALLQEVKTAKQNYQDLFNQRSMLLNEVTYIKSMVNSSKVAFCSAFSSWYARKYALNGDGMEQLLFKSSSSQQNQAEGGAGGGMDLLDDGEKFEKLQYERAIQAEPDSWAFYNARKQMTQIIKQKKIAGAAKPVKRK